jgi:RNA polymerase sigma-70 factor, ECF subfamily
VPASARPLSQYKGRWPVKTRLITPRRRPMKRGLSPAERRTSPGPSLVWSISVRRCYKIAAVSTIDSVSRTQSSGAPPPKRDEYYSAAIHEFGRALDRLAAGYEADPDKRHDLRQNIHFQLLRSFEVFDGRCSLKTWTFRVAHNTAVSYVKRERRENAGLVSLEEIEQTAPSEGREPDIDQQRTLQQLSHFIRRLKPLDRQIMISYLEDIDTATIAEITGLTPANIRMKIHRIKSILSSRFLEEKRYV